MRYKQIVSLAVAQALIKRGFVVKEVKKSTRQRERLVFSFEDSAELRKAFSEIIGK